jgi:hypothetical protein
MDRCRDEEVFRDARQRSRLGLVQRLTISFAGIAIGLLIVLPLSAQSRDPAAQLASALDSMEVEQRWIAGAHVDWRSGEPDGKKVSEHGVHSHCSAFVAAASERLGVYILRPPEHPQTFLANAQSDWLAEQGEQHGWISVGTADEAQRAANEGALVVAVYRTSSDQSAGHIAIVRPGNKSARLLRAEGPDIIQAGQENYLSTSLRNGFRHHGSAWRLHAIRFYRHAVTWPR